jgi:hypothetical protein
VTAVTGLLLAAWTALSAGIAVSEGHWSMGGLVLVVLATVVLAGTLLLRDRVAGREPAEGTADRRGELLGRAGLVLAAGWVMLGALVAEPGYYAHGPWWTAARLLAGAGVVAAGVLTARPARRRWSAVPLALLGAAFGATVMAAPAPNIDVWYLLQQSTRGLLSGADMYRQTWVGGYGLRAVYPYLPWTSVLLAPARLLGDVRIGEAAALVGAAALLVAMRRNGPVPSRVRTLAPLLVVAFPAAPYAIEQAWTEPLLVLLLIGGALAVRSGHRAAAVVAFALALACKQHVTLLLPLLFAWPAFGRRRAAAAVLLAGAFVSPWLLAGPRDFWHDAVTVNLGYKVLPGALDLPALATRHGVTLSFAPLLAALVVVYVVALRRRVRDTTWFLLWSAQVLLVLDLLNKQSFFNHYALPLALVAAAVVTENAGADDDAAPGEAEVQAAAGEGQGRAGSKESSDARS